MGPTSEQVLPTKWVLFGVPDRKTFSQHVLKLKKQYGIAVAKACVRQAIWIGCLPVNRDNILKSKVFNCDTCHANKGKMHPPHFASKNCESGKRNHCTCPICWG